MLCVVCYVLYMVRNVCISLVFKTFLELCLGLEKVSKWELLILHRFYSAFCVLQRCNNDSAADLTAGVPGPRRG